MMEYMEVPSVPKGMLEKLFASEALRRMSVGACTATGASTNGYRPLPPVVFSNAREFLCHADDSSLPLVTSLGLNAVPLFDPKKRETMIPIANIEPWSGPQQSLMKEVTRVRGFGDMPPRQPVKAMQLEGAIERGSKKRGERGNGDSGIRSKRSKVDLAPPSAGFTNIEGPTSRRRRQRKRGSGNGEQGDKPPSRRRNRPITKNENKSCQLTDCTQNEPSVKLATKDSGKLVANSIIGVQSIKMQPVNLVRYMEDITIEGLMSGEMSAIASVGKESSSERDDAERALLKQINSSLQLLPKPVGIEPPLHRSLVPILASNREYGLGKTLTIDLERAPLSGGKEEALPMDAENELCSNMQTAHEGMHQSDKKLAKDPSVFSVYDLPLYPLENFVSVLNLQPIEQLESLLLPATVDMHLETSAHLATSGSSHCRNINLPPLPLSSKICQVSCEVDHDKNRNMNCWFRAEPLKCTSANKDNSWFDAWKKRGLKDARHLGNSCKRVKVDRLQEIDLNKKLIEETEVGAISMSYGNALQPEQLSTIAMQEAHLLTINKEKREREILDAVNTVASNRTECEPYCCARSVDGNQSHLHGSVCISHNKFTANNLARSNSLAERQELFEIQEAQKNNEARPTLKTGNFNGQKMSQNSEMDVPQPVSSQMPPVQSPVSQEISCISLPCNDGPDSPRVQVAAHLLCNMANSKSLFYTPMSQHPEVLGKKVPKSEKFYSLNKTIGEIHCHEHDSDVETKGICRKNGQIVGEIKHTLAGYLNSNYEVVLK